MDTEDSLSQEIKSLRQTLVVCLIVGLLLAARKWSFKLPPPKVGEDVPAWLAKCLKLLDDPYYYPQPTHNFRQ